MPLDIFSLSLIGFVSSALAGLAILLTKGWHMSWTMDNLHGVQKFHQTNVPRVGGVVILLGLLVIEWVDPIVLGSSFNYLFLAGLIPFLFGFWEDLFKNVSISVRLVANGLGPIVFIALSGLYLDHLDIPGIDAWMALAPVGMAFTVLAVCGVTNAINIIDGFHGLAIGTVILILLAFAYVAYGTQDTDLFNLAILLAAVSAGFMALNYPFGKIFIGDGGAYFLGFMVGQIAILLPMRNPEVSPWMCLLICAYPVVEVLYSMYRRIRNQKSSGAPDDQHLHTLIKTKIIRVYFPHLSQSRRNALVAPLIWILVAACGVVACKWGNSTSILVVCFGLFVLVYHLTYRLISSQRSTQ
jgi:UDP-N-acetylmuramyl pentapeptide phosphotransferase/UDP-N-acetylglucosamine-1-phosphate transferase